MTPLAQKLRTALDDKNHDPTGFYAKILVELGGHEPREGYGIACDSTDPEDQKMLAALRQLDAALMELVEAEIADIGFTACCEGYAIEPRPTSHAELVDTLYEMYEDVLFMATTS